MIVVGIIGLLVAIAIPNFIRYRTESQTRTCVANLRQMDDCKQEWAVEMKQGLSSIPVPEDLEPYLRIHKLPTCPANGVYRLRRVSRTPVCSLSSNGHTLNNLNPDEDALPD